MLRTMIGTTLACLLILVVAMLSGCGAAMTERRDPDGSFHKAAAISIGKDHGLESGKYSRTSADGSSVNIELGGYSSRAKLEEIKAILNR